MNRAFLYFCGVLYLGYGLWVLLSPATSLACLNARRAPILGPAHARG